MPLTLSEILSNERVVVFSYAEDTITVRYKPYAIQGAQYKRFLSLAKRTGTLQPKGFIKRLIWRVRRVKQVVVFKHFLKAVLSSWDISENGKALSISEGLERLPALFIEKLYYQMVHEIITITRETSTEELKKK